MKHDKQYFIQMLKIFILGIFLGLATYSLLRGFELMHLNNHIKGALYLSLGGGLLVLGLERLISYFIDQVKR